MTDHQARARELLAKFEACPVAWMSERVLLAIDLATELRAALDRETEWRGHAADLAQNLAKAEARERDALAEVERLKLLALDQWTQKTTVTQPVTGRIGVTDSRCDYLMPRDMICNKCGRLHDGGSRLSAGGRRDLNNAFTGRQTGRNRADIPTDAGVPLREAELRERFDQECGGTIVCDESGFGSGMSFGRGDVARAIGQPPSHGDAQGGGE